MVYAKFQDHKTSGSGEEDFFKVLTNFFFINSII